jgi:hypothetical protein
MRKSVLYPMAMLTLLAGAAALADSSTSTSSNTAPPATSQIDSPSDVSSNTTGMDQPGTLDKGSMNTGNTTTTSPSTPGTVDPNMNKGNMPADQAAVPVKGNEMAKMELAPHAVIVESSLQSALIDVKAMRNQLKLTDGSTVTVPANFWTSLRDLSREVNLDVKKAMEHNTQLESSARNHPSFVKSEDIRGVGAALSDVQRINSTWQSKASSEGYWKNREQARTDLDNLERRLNTAIDKARSFNSDKLDLSTIG